MTIKVSPVDNYVSHIFPVGIYARENILSTEENDIVCNKIYKMRDVFKEGNTKDWMSGAASPDNCFHIADLAEYLEFMPLIQRITACVNDFATHTMVAMSFTHAQNHGIMFTQVEDIKSSTCIHTIYSPQYIMSRYQLVQLAHILSVLIWVVCSLPRRRRHPHH